MSLAGACGLDPVCPTVAALAVPNAWALDAQQLLAPVSVVVRSKLLVSCACVGQRFVVCTALPQVVDTCELLESACGWQWPQSDIRQPGVLGDSVLGACLGCGDCNLTAAGTQHTCFQQRTAVLLSTRPTWVPLGSFLTHTRVW